MNSSRETSGASARYVSSRFALGANACSFSFFLVPSGAQSRRNPWSFVLGVRVLKRPSSQSWTSDLYQREKRRSEGPPASAVRAAGSPRSVIKR
jgi:hypothetical protein